MAPQRLLLSIQLALMTLVFALPLAVLIAVMRVAPVALPRGAAMAYVEAVRNVPLLAHMLFWYFGAPEFLPDSAKAWLYEGNGGNQCRDCTGVLHGCLYVGRPAQRPAFDSQRADGGQPRAGLQFSGVDAAGHPAAIAAHHGTAADQPDAEPLENTSIAMVIGVGELMYQAQQVESASFRWHEAFTFATVGYLGISLLITLLSSWYQHVYPVRTS